MSYPTPTGPLEEGTVQIREVAVSYRGAWRSVPKKIDGPDTVVHFMRKLVGNDAREHFVVLHLDGRHRAIGYQVASVGTATASLIHPREVFQPAIAIGAAAIIASHNHPSGDPSPSTEDHEITKRLVDAGMLLGIRLFDHVVYAERGYHSCRQEHSDWFSN